MNIEVDDDGSAYLICPVSMFPGEPGDEFPEATLDLLRCMAMTGWYAVDFGESTDTHVTLWLKKSVKDRNEVDSVDLMENFIARGGDV